MSKILDMCLSFIFLKLNYLSFLKNRCNVVTFIVTFKKSFFHLKIVGQWKKFLKNYIKFSFFNQTC